jgi:hypothetical protein
LTDEGDARRWEREVLEGVVYDADAIGDETGFAGRSCGAAETAVGEGNEVGVGMEGGIGAVDVGALVLEEVAGILDWLVNSRYLSRLELTP